MKFINREQLNTYLKGLVYLGQGNQGVCYLKVSGSIVLKIFHSFDDEEDILYSEEEILRFSHIKNKTFIWPSDVIWVGNRVVGYCMPYKKAYNLFDIDPLKIRLDSFDKGIKIAEEDIRLLTDNGVGIYDMKYNTLYRSGRIYVIDTLDYGSYGSSYEDNRRAFDEEVKQFLVDNYFDSFVNSDKVLREMYNDTSFSGREFLYYFRKKISEYVGEDITTLNKGKRLVKRSDIIRYERNIRLGGRCE